HDKDQVAFVMESFLRNAGASLEESAPIVYKVARAKNPIEINAAIRDGLKATYGLLARAGVEDAGLRSRLTQWATETHEAVRATSRAALWHQGPSDAPVMIGGEAGDVLDGVLINELAP